MMVMMIMMEMMLKIKLMRSDDTDGDGVKDLSLPLTGGAGLDFRLSFGKLSKNSACVSVFLGSGARR